MKNSWTIKNILPLTVLASIELAWRTVANILDIADLILFPIGGVLISREVLNVAAIGRFMGLLLLGIAAFQTLPEVFPDRYVDWGNDVIGRSIVAGGIVGAASLFDGLLGELPYPYFDGGPFNPEAMVVLLVGLGCLTGMLTIVYHVWTVPQWRPLRYSIRYRQRPDGRDPVMPPVSLLVSRVVLIVALGGLAFAVISHLYPLPELFVIGMTVYESVAGQVSIRTDIAEGFVAGLQAIWGGPRGVLGVCYGIGCLLFIIWVNIIYSGLTGGHVAALSKPVTATFLLATLGVGTVHAVTALVRLIERLPAEFGINRAGTKPRIPGLLVPAGALYALYEAVRPSTGGDPYALSASVPEAGVALAVAVVAVVFLARPSLGPKFPDSDYKAIVLGPALFFALYATTAILDLGNPSSFPIPNPLLILVVTGSFGLSPFLGYELFRTDRDETCDTIFRHLLSEGVRAGSFALVFTIVVSLLSIVLPEDIVLVVSSLALWPALFGASMRLLLLPFYFPEQVSAWVE